MGKHPIGERDPAASLRVYPAYYLFNGADQ